jgi:membrane protein implicated in regulation of membrane protease activity
MEPWMIWVITAIVLAIIEMFSMSFFSLCLAFGALCAAVAAGLGAGLSGQLLLFAAGSAVAFIFVRPVMLKYFLRSDRTVPTGIDALLGRIGKVSEAIDPEMDCGRVAIDGDDWKAVSVDNQPIAFGERVEIVQVESATVFVRKID